MSDALATRFEVNVSWWEGGRYGQGRVMMALAPVNYTVVSGAEDHARRSVRRITAENQASGDVEATIHKVRFDDSTGRVVERSPHGTWVMDDTGAVVEATTEADPERMAEQRAQIRRFLTAASGITRNVNDL